MSAILGAALVTGACFVLLNSHHANEPTEAPARHALKAYGRLPLAFEANRGQTDARVKFVSRGIGATFFLTPADLTIVRSTRPAVGKPLAGRVNPGGHPTRKRSAPASRSILRMQFVGANPLPAIEGVEELPGRTNYFIGGGARHSGRGIPNFRRVRYARLYPGIDLVFYGNQRRLEHDFVVSPGADPDAIRLAWQGVERLELDAGGNLVVHANGARLVLQAPHVYQPQQGAGSRRTRTIPGEYVLMGKNEVGFRVAAYDRGRPLIIDPVLLYSTYLGGSDFDYDYVIAVDGSGSAYVTGTTSSTNFPTANALQGSNAGTAEAFVSKLNPAGTALVYSTYLGGSGADYGNGIAVDGSGNAYVVGSTDSTNFPTASPLQGANGGGFDVFVSKLDPSGSALVYSTYLGGGDSDFGYGIAVDGSGNAYVTGYTLSTNFPTLGPLQAAKAGNADAFISKLNASGASLAYSTYFGGTGYDEGYGIAVNSAGNAHVTGTTASTNFPTMVPVQAAKAGSLDAFASKLNTTGSALAYSTYLGGTSEDHGYGIAVDGSGSAYVSGTTASTNFPTAGAIQGTNGGDFDAFVLKLPAAGGPLAYSTYLGGNDADYGISIAVDGAGNAYVAGATSSTNFPTADPLQGANAGFEDAFVSKLHPSGSSLVYSTYLGGADFDYAYGVAVDGAGNAYVAGATASTGFPTMNPIQGANAGEYDAFIAKLGDSPSEVPTLSGLGAGFLLLLLARGGCVVIRRRPRGARAETQG